MRLETNIYKNMENNQFAVFIMVHGRPDKMWTYNTLRKCGYTGKIFLVADNLDKTLNEYKLKYGNELLVFDKKEASKEMDSGDNTGDLRSTLFAANKIFDLAKENNIKHFFIMCDDYYYFGYRYMSGARIIKNLDKVFELFPGYDNFDANQQVINIKNNSGRSDRNISASLDNQFVEYTWTANNLPQFSAYQIKVENTTTNQAQSPKIRNFRAIALA